MLKVKLFYLSLIVCCAVIVEAQECGNAKFSSELIYGGEYSKRGQWPWLCTLHDIESDEFFCGSTLISNRHVLTGELSKQTECDDCAINIPPSFVV